MQKRRIRGTALVNRGIYEGAYFANRRGVLGESEWTRFESAICRRFNDADEIWSAEGFTPMDELLTAEFVTHIESLCQ